MAVASNDAFVSAQGLKDRLGVFVDDELLVLALTHRSFAHEHGNIPTNERLEFLGDAVLQIVVTDWLYRDFNDLPEGGLARRRAAIVSQPALAWVGRNLELGQYILLGNGEKASGGADKDSILCDTVEAVLGAVYLSNDLAVAGQLIHRLVSRLYDRAARLGAGLDWKTSLQEKLAELKLDVPVYQVVGQGPDHMRSYRATVTSGDRELGQGIGSSKKQAEIAAAQAAYEAMTDF